MVFVNPVQNMVIRPGQHVSIEGKIYHPFLAHWQNHGDVRKAVVHIWLRDAVTDTVPILEIQRCRPDGRIA